VAIKKRNGLNRQKIEEDRQEHERHQNLQQQGQQLQQEQLRDLLHNPQVFELLTRPDNAGTEPWLEEIVGEHLHIDQVLSTYDRDDLWRKGWANKIWANKVSMSYPFPESRSDHERVQDVQRRIHGHDKRPLTTDEERKVRAKFEQKTDREKRGKDGEFTDLLLSQVVRSEERSSEKNDSGGLLSGLRGGD
jgi:hypothetical protein